MTFNQILPDTPLLLTSGLTKDYSGRTVVDDVSITAYSREVYGFIGPNGAGKTTIIRMIIGLLFPTLGTISLFGEIIGPGSVDVKRRIGVMGEQTYLLPDMTALEYLHYFSDIYHIPRLPQRTWDLIDRLELLPYINVIARDFSHGMKKKLSFIRALLHCPDLIILDEPVSGLDPNGIIQVREIITEEKKRGAAIFLSSHILSEVEIVADRIGIIDHGRLLLEDKIDAIRRRLNPDSLMVIELMDEIPSLAHNLSQLQGVKKLTIGNNLLFIEIDGQKSTRKMIAKAVADQKGVIVDVKTKDANLELMFSTLIQNNKQAKRNSS